MKEDKIDDVVLENIPEQYRWLIDSGLVTTQGFRIQGMGILIRKLERMIELQDKTNLKLHFIEKKLE